MAVYETREQWGSQQSDPAGYQIGRVSELIAHHFWRPHVPATATHSDERATMRSVQRNHTNEQGWDDIAYQWVVFGSGRGYEGRGWFRTGAHTAGRNSKSVGIAFAIDGDDHTPTDKAWETARAIAAEGIQVGALTDDYTLSGHQDYASYKSCPGDKTYPIIGEHLSSSLIQKEDDMPLSEDDIQAVARAVWGGATHGGIDLPHAKTDNKQSPWRYLGIAIRSNATDADTVRRIVRQEAGSGNPDEVADRVVARIAEELGG